MFQDASDDKRLLDECNNLHASPALRAPESIDIPDLFQKYSPQLSSAAGNAAPWGLFLFYRARRHLRHLHKSNENLHDKFTLNEYIESKRILD